LVEQALCDRLGLSRCGSYTWRSECEKQKMNIGIEYIADPGVVGKERLVLKVIRDDDIGYYAVFDTKYTQDGKISNKVQRTYWFPDKSVKAGDLIILYTKIGNQSENKNKDGSTSHFFYWDLASVIWTKEKDCAVLLRIDDWKSKGSVQK